MDLNKVMIIGRLTAAPELRNIANGTPVTNFSVATNFVYTDKQSGTKKEIVEFHNIVAWRKLAEICSQYLGKGRRIYIEGRLQTRNWDDPNGFKRYRTEIVAENMIMLDPPAESSKKAIIDQNQSPAEANVNQNSKKQTNNQVQEDNIPTIDINEDNPQTDEEEVSVEDIPF